MKHILLLKKLAFLADRLEKYSSVDFRGTKIVINTLLDKSELLSYALKVFEIPYQEYTPDHDLVAPPDEINFSIGQEVDIKVMYLLAYVAKEVFEKKIKMYISYVTEPAIASKVVLFGTYITINKELTNISSPISLDQIISLNIDEMDWNKLIELFPIKIYSSDGRANIASEERYCDNCHKDPDYNQRESYGQYAGSYAQDVAGLSDDFINEALDGIPDAYWNID